ncbi:hypothetical protein Hamer_G013271 [Homarus americanus]|uniref:Uncharacterized protein n=1 Tax=Homarus americanus TaxID=6706 RepID=A0A8J5MZ78_HOMAM|nr:hypothetical protein Hamer_G013271 [Homarus americanus]
MNHRPSDSKEKVVLEGREDLTRETFDNGFTDIFSRNLPTKEFMGDFAIFILLPSSTTILNLFTSSTTFSSSPSFSRPPPQSSHQSPSGRERPIPTQEPFSSTSFTGQQFSSKFTDLDPFFESARLTRKRRDVTARQDVSTRLTEIIDTPWEDGSLIDDSHNPTFDHDGLGPVRSALNRPHSPHFSRSKHFRRLHQFTPGLRPGPSPPAHILPPSSSVRAPRHILMENRRLPKATRQQDIPLIRKRRLVTQRRISEEPVSSDAEEAREDSLGFMRGKPDNFPGFHTIGGFGPMGELEKGNVAGTFMEEFKIPSVAIPVIQENQPQFSPHRFSQQVSLREEEGPQPQQQQPLPQQPHHPQASGFQQFSPSLSQNDEDGFRLVFSNDAVSHLDTSSLPPSPPHSQPPSHNVLPITADHRPVRPSATLGGKPKKTNRNPFSSFLDPIRGLVQPSRQRFSSRKQTLDNENPHNENQHGVYDESKISKTRVRRRAGEPDTSDPANIPHKRVHRVQVDSQVPHSRNPREFQTVHDSETAYSEVPLQFEPFPSFNYPDFQAQRTSPLAGRGTHFGERSLLPVQYSKDFRVEADKVQVHTPDDDIIIPDGQRFYPTFNGRHGPPLPASQQLFFPSPPILPRAPGPRGGRLLPRGPAFRESPSQREQSSFRDFHNSFHSPGGREAIHKPEFSFPSSRHPFHREHEQGNFDNSLLGSGNFEILRGGTFYDDDDPNGYHHEYDHLLDDGYIVFPDPHSASHSNNYVDDFFSNFRDFSEFAVRKSEEGESTFLGDGTYFGRGYASEQVNKVVGPELAPSSVLAKDSVLKINQEDTDMKTGRLNDPAANESKTSRNDNERHQHRQPKNIQEVLEDIDPRPSEYASSFLTVNEKDPMIAMF